MEFVLRGVIYRRSMIDFKRAIYMCYAERVIFLNSGTMIGSNLYIEYDLPSSEFQAQNLRYTRMDDIAEGRYIVQA